MASWRYRTKDIKPGDIVLYNPSWQPITDDYVDNQLLATGPVIETEQLINRMNVTVNWNMPAVPRVVDVNDVEVLRREAL